MKVDFPHPESAANPITTVCPSAALHTTTARLPGLLTFIPDGLKAELELATHDWPWKDDVSCADRAAALVVFAPPRRGVETAVDAAEVHAMAAITAAANVRSYGQIRGCK